MKLLIAIFILIFPYEAKASNIPDLIEKTTVYLIKTWNDDENLKNWFPPQVITVPSGTRLFGIFSTGFFKVIRKTTYFFPNQ